jgi:hypothetical protein
MKLDPTGLLVRDGKIVRNGSRRVFYFDCPNIVILGPYPEDPVEVRPGVACFKFQLSSEPDEQWLDLFAETHQTKFCADIRGLRLEIRCDVSALPQFVEEMKEVIRGTNDAYRTERDEYLKEIKIRQAKQQENTVAQAATLESYRKAMADLKF